PYAVYNMTADPEDINVDKEMLDRRSPYYAVRNEHSELLGFFSFGTSAQPWSSNEPSIYTDNKTVTIGLGMRPDLTGKGSGLAFVNAGLNFAQQQFQPNAFRLYVLTFNERAIRVYEKARFRRVRAMEIENSYGKRKFVEMEREAS
ncbi:MAG: GNAT family N-acetyltransferase, partial [Chloroflexota bacterium]|nr:GNAT family N-acetyltransferase [Chloroflexota bacterium]